jgi:arylformamidase
MRNIVLEHNGIRYAADLNRPLDISIPLQEGADTVNCFYAPYLELAPVRDGSFVGAVAEGGPVNFFNVRLNPHGNGTHTECVGHIASEKFTLNQCLTNFHFVAKLHSVYPQMQANGDRVILPEQLEDVLEPGEAEALVIRTLPNSEDKCRRHYSGTNPPYLHPDALRRITQLGIRHLLIDLPSVDREEDGGALAAHKAFWNYPEEPRTEATITELIFVNNFIPDGLYLLNIQITPLELDASPSKPVLYTLNKMT